MWEAGMQTWPPPPGRICPNSQNTTRVGDRTIPLPSKAPMPSVNKVGIPNTVKPSVHIHSKGCALLTLTRAICWKEMSGCSIAWPPKTPVALGTFLLGRLTLSDKIEPHQSSYSRNSDHSRVVFRNLDASLCMSDLMEGHSYWAG